VKRREPRSPVASAARCGLPADAAPLLSVTVCKNVAAGIGFDWPDLTGPLAKVRKRQLKLEKEQLVGAEEVRSKKRVRDFFFAR